MGYPNFEIDPQLEEMDDLHYCGSCNGSGEGMYDGSTCQSCHGMGTVHGECERDDIEFDEARDRALDEV